MFFDVPVKNKEGGYERNIEISKGNDYTTDNLLDYEYFSKHYTLIAVDLSKQIELEDPNLKQQINFLDKLEDDRLKRFSSLRNQKKQFLNVHKNCLSII